MGGIPTSAPGREASRASWKAESAGPPAGLCAAAAPAMGRGLKNRADIDIAGPLEAEHPNVSPPKLRHTAGPQHFPHVLAHTLASTPQLFAY